jgi:hypothetical protein
MARFRGKVGYAVPTQSAPGVWKDVITEVTYSGDVVRNTRQLQNGTKINDDVTVTNSIHIIGDAYAFDTFFAIRYVQWMGALWIVTDVEVQRPRLFLRLGGVYNGPKAVTPSGP